MSASKQENNHKDDVSAYYALHVAVQTLKERCLTLQERLVAVENENLNYKREADSDQKSNTSNNEQNGRNEVELLRIKVNELTRQKTQLNEHISMIATENRQLWQRLTNLTKDGQNVEDMQAMIKDMTNSTTTSTHQNLIRSKTFTQNSPNPMLRQKLNVLAKGGDENGSLEEISLKVLNDFLQGKAEFEKKCGEIIPATNPQSNLLGFGYLNDETVDTDLQNGTKKCLDGMSEIKKELLRQQSDLKVALSSLRQRKGKSNRIIPIVCSVCLNVRFFCLIYNSIGNMFNMSGEPEETSHRR